MNKERYLVITFKTTTKAMYFEDVSKGKVDGRIIPLPKEIDAGCGLAWASKNLDETFWKEYVEKNRLDYDQMVEVLI
ncbi:MAG: DUF3343 domain-containing protein [Holdemanella sp.]|nr:DUF3343 domain-containing protein [Holdemanella sp.]